MGKIGDLWVRLGLKKGDFDKGIKDAEKQTSGLGSVFGKLKLAGVAAFTGLVAAISKFAKDAKNLTQTWGDAWNIEMAGVTAAYQTFVRQLASGEGFDNLFHNMREAARVAREVASALDELFERKISFSYEEAEVRRQISDLQLIMRDASKSEAEREAAAKKIIELNEKLREVKKDIAQQEADTLRESARNQTGLNDAQLDYLVKEYNQNREVIKQAREYNKERERLGAAYDQAMHTRGSGLWAQQLKDQMDALEANTSQQVKDVAAMTKGYDKVNDDLIRGLAQAEVAVINVDTEVNNLNTRASSTLGRLSSGSGSTSPADQERERANRIAQQASDSLKAEETLLAEHYERDKALLEKYGLDTTDLTAKYYNDLHDIIVKGLDDIEDDTEVLEEELDLSDIDLNLAKASQQMTTFVDKFEEGVERAKALKEEFISAVVEGFSSGIQELTDQLFGLEDVNPGRIFRALLSPLADLAIREGEILLATGLGVEAVKEALASLNGVAAITAGAALVAIGAAAKSGLAALAKGGSSTTTASYSGASGGDLGSQTLHSELVVRVEGTIKGRDIVLSGQQTINDQNR